MSDTFIELNSGSGGSKIDARSISGGDVREVIVIGDGTTDTAIAPVTLANGLLVDASRIQGNVTVVQATATNLKVDASGVAVPITDNSGSLTVDGTIAASNLPTTVDTNSGNKSASTIRVVLATDQPALTAKLLVTPDLPSGASTAAKQPALGTAGSSSTDVISVQGIASGTALPVSVASIPSHAVTNAGTFAVQNTAATPAGTNMMGVIAAALATDAIMNSTTALTPKFVAISCSSSGNNTIVAAVNPKKIRVLAYNFMANAAVNGKFQSGASGTDLTGLKYCVANGGLCAPFNPVGWFETASNTLLNLNLSGAVAVGGELVYVEV